MKIRIFLLVVLLISIGSCVQDNKKGVETISKENYFIQSPLPSADVPFDEYSVDAAKGDTLFHKTGSIILFPSNAFVDKEGKLIKGIVDVKYREFSKPLDFYLAGIPLDYDSLGTTYSFESSGMCELLASKDGVPVFVNPSSRPEINIVSDNTSNNHSIYFLDTVKKNWVNREMSVVTDLRTSTDNGKSSSDKDLVAPLKPEKANDKGPIIEIAIGLGSYKELMIYDNLKFQIDPREKTFSPKDADEIWKQVELVKRDGKGLYTVKFTNDQRSVSYYARPVLEGEDYNKALLVFEKKNAEYKRKLSKRLEKEAVDKEEYKRKARLNALIVLRNKKIEEENKRIDSLNEITNKENKKIEQENKTNEATYNKKVKEIEALNRKNKTANDELDIEIERQKLINEKYDSIYKSQARDRAQFSKILRSFSVDGFGIWNCDRAVTLDGQYITATFKDQKGNHLNLSYIAVGYTPMRGIQTFYNNKIYILKEGKNMIFAVNNGKLTYLSSKDFAKLNITPEMDTYTFVMKTVPEKNNNYEFLTVMLGE